MIIIQLLLYLVLYSILIFTLMAVAYHSLIANCIRYAARDNALEAFIEHCSLPIRLALKSTSILREDYTKFQADSGWKMGNIVYHNVVKIIYFLVNGVFIWIMAGMANDSYSSTGERIFAMLMLIIHLLLSITALRFGYSLKHYTSKRKAKSKPNVERY